MTTPADVATAAPATATGAAAPAREKAGLLPLSPPIAYACAFASGLLYWAAFPGVDLWPLTFVCWVPLIVAMHRQPVTRAALLGLLAGLTMNVAGFTWLQSMLTTFSGFPTVVCTLFLLIVCGYQGLRIGFLGWVYGRATARGWPALPMFAAAFVTSELLFPVLFWWYYAATVHQVPVLMQVGDLGGPVFAGLVLVAVNIALAEPLLARLEGRPIARGPVVTGAATLAFTLLYGALRVRAVDAAAQAAPEATVGVVQADMGLQEKRTDLEEGIRRHLSLSDELRAKGVDFLVWSETSAMRPVRDATYTTELRTLTRKIGLPAIFGAVIVKHVPDERGYVFYNSAVSSAADGTVDGRYDKEVLLAFGEYLPFGDTFPILYKWSPNSGRFSSGTSPDPILLDVHGQKHPVSALICYEDILPEFTNVAVRHAKPELLVNMTNDAWFGDTSEPWEHLALSQLRAVEHHRYFVRGTNSGVSAIIDPVGRTIAHSGTFRPEAISGTIHWMQSRTVYEILGDWPWLIVSCGALFAAFRRRRTTAVAAA
jgi:apolipoprotein N-acyltransferase